MIRLWSWNRGLGPLVISINLIISISLSLQKTNINNIFISFEIILFSVELKSSLYIKEIKIEKKYEIIYNIMNEKYQNVIISKNGLDYDSCIGEKRDQN